MEWPILRWRRAAVEKTVGVSEESIQLKDIVWEKQFPANSHVEEIHIGLFPEENGEIAYEIYTAHPTDEKSAIHNPESAINSIVHNQGLATFSSSGQVPPLDLTSLQKMCAQNVLSADECYATFKRMGIEYGPAYQGIEKRSILERTKRWLN
ncbi:MAG: hypothetical protein GKR87_07635 [Kiritimatiellae bacterium]|nr:hypothetical protein [Kiritimatiellia bacterium]